MLHAIWELISQCSQFAQAKKSRSYFKHGKHSCVRYCIAYMYMVACDEDVHIDSD